MPIRIVIADDNDIFRVATFAALKGADPSIELVGEAATADAAVTRCGLLRPDAIILDNNMPGRTGAEVIPEIRRESPRTKIIMFTASEQTEGMGAADAIVRKSAFTPFLDIVDRIHHLLGPEASRSQ